MAPVPQCRVKDSAVPLGGPHPWDPSPPGTHLPRDPSPPAAGGGAEGRSYQPVFSEALSQLRERTDPEDCFV